MTARLELPQPLAPAAHYASAHPENLLARQLVAAIRVGRGFSPRWPLRLLALARRFGAELADRDVLAIVMAGFRGSPLRRLLVALTAIVAAYRRGPQPRIWSLDSGERSSPEWMSLEDAARLAPRTYGSPADALQPPLPTSSPPPSPPAPVPGADPASPSGRPGFMTR